MPKVFNKDFPPPLISLKETKFIEMAYHKLLDACKSVLINITQMMADSVEEATRDQVNRGCGLSTELDKLQLLE